MHKIINALTNLALLGLTLFSVTAQNTYAQNSSSPDYSAIDAFLQSELQILHIPGAALSIVHGDQIVHVKAFGMADPSGRAVTPNTPFILASVSKSFTALAVMQLVEEGKLDLDAPVQRYLSWFQVADPAASKAITVRMLLNHTSGLPTQAGFLAILKDDQSAGALEQSVRDLRSVPLDRAPGSKYEYNNANYDILGLIVQVVSGQSYASYIQQQIFAPLEMTQSFTSRSDAAGHGLAEGYQHMFGLPVARQWPYPSAMLPSGFLTASAQDLAHYVIAQLNGGQYKGQSILSAQGITAMHKGTARMNADESYGMGWVDAMVKGTHLVGHDGDSYNYHTSVYLLPESKWGLVLLMNGSNYMNYTRMLQLPLTLTAMLIGIQLPPFTPVEQLLLVNEFYRNAFVFAFLLIGMAAWAGVRLRRWSRQPESRPTGSRRIAFLVIPLAFFLWQFWLFLFSLPKAMGGLPLNTLFIIRPDLIGLAVVLALFSLIWGIYFGVRASQLLLGGRLLVTGETAQAVV